MMDTMKNLALIIWMICGGMTLNGQSLESRFHQAYLDNDLAAWEAGIAELSRTYEQSSDPNLLLQMAKAGTGAIGSCFAKRDMDTAALWADKTEEYCQLFLESSPQSAEGKALLAGVYGMKIGLSPMKGMFLGPKAGRLLTEAVTLDKECPMTHYQLGISAYNTPEQWGGSKIEAAKHLANAKQYYESSGSTKTWEYLNTLAWLGQSQHALQQYDAAKASYEQALDAEPDFGWVKIQLLPATEAAILAK